MDNARPVEAECKIIFKEYILTKEQKQELANEFEKILFAIPKEFEDFGKAVIHVNTAFKETDGLLKLLNKKEKFGKGDRRKNKKNFNQQFRR